MILGRDVFAAMDEIIFGVEMRRCPPLSAGLRSAVRFSACNVSTGVSINLLYCGQPGARGPRKGWEGPAAEGGWVLTGEA